VPAPHRPPFALFLGFTALALGAGDLPPVRAAEAPPSRLASGATRLTEAALASDHAWTRLSELCDGIGHRLSGSASLERAIDWAAAAMRADGADSVWTEPVTVPRWVRGRESATMVTPGPHTIAMLGLGRSVGTPPGGITAPVVAVKSFGEFEALPDDAVRGKIVLWNVPFTTYGPTVRYRSQGANRAGRRGAVASLVRSVGPIGHRTPHTGNMAAYNDSGPRVPGAAVSVEDAERIQRLLDRGEEVRVRLEMEADTLTDGTSRNVIAELRGRERPDEIVVVGGHIDSWDVGQGAHDDGGGCVISMEALRLLVALDLRPRRTVRVVLWTNEENGVRGGEAYAKNHGKDPKRRHVAAVESDGGVERPVGFKLTVRQQGPGGSPDSTDAARTAEAVARLKTLAPLLASIGADKLESGGGGADIVPLMKLGVPGVEHQTTMARYFEWHHTEADALSAVDPGELKKNVAAMAVLIWALAEMDGTL